jgi:DNA-binding protein HU-beta
VQFNVKMFQKEPFGLFYKGIYVNKAQLIDSVAEAVDLPKNVAGRAVDAVLDSITKALTKGEEVAVKDFATFGVKLRAARTGRNPKTGGPLEIPATTVVSFKPSKGLKNAVNGVKLTGSVSA